MEHKAYYPSMTARKTLAIVSILIGILILILTAVVALDNLYNSNGGAWFFYVLFVLPGVMFIHWGRKQYMSQCDESFRLIDLMIIVSIVAILAAIAMPADCSFEPTHQKNTDSQ